MGKSITTHKFDEPEFEPRLVKPWILDASNKGQSICHPANPQSENGIHLPLTKSLNTENNIDKHQTIWSDRWMCRLIRTSAVRICSKDHFYMELPNLFLIQPSIILGARCEEMHMYPILYHIIALFCLFKAIESKYVNKVNEKLKKSDPPRYHHQIERQTNTIKQQQREQKAGRVLWSL